jgi:hypothetical protein
VSHPWVPQGDALQDGRRPAWPPQGLLLQRGEEADGRSGPVQGAVWLLPREAVREVNAALTTEKDSRPGAAPLWGGTTAVAIGHDFSQGRAGWRQAGPASEPLGLAWTSMSKQSRPREWRGQLLLPAQQDGEPPGGGG